MRTLKWSNRYKLDVPEVDAQHRRWFGLTGAFLELVQSSQTDTAVIEAALVDIIDYTKEHFANEEALMRKIRFPASEYERHCNLHRKFAASAERMAEQWMTGKPVEATEIATFMSGWLTGHILSEDIKYISYCLSAEAEHEQRGSRKRCKR